MTESEQIGVEIIEGQTKEYEAIIRDLGAELAQLRALACRVHAECGPVFDLPPFPDDINAKWICVCGNESDDRDPFPHKPDCLWLAADALLRKVGEI